MTCLAALASEVPRFQVTVSVDAEVLANVDLSRYKLIVLNYVDWSHPGLSETGRSNFLRYLKNGGGLTIVHFANAAFSSGRTGWPEFRKICRRVWDQSKSTHDPYESFHVTVVDSAHPAARDVISYQVKDELYCNQQGMEPIHVLATAQAKGTGKDEPVAFVYEYAKGRVFQTVLGHDAAANSGAGDHAVDSIREPMGSGAKVAGK